MYTRDKMSDWADRECAGRWFGMTLQLLCGSSSTRAMRLEVGMASGRLAAGYACVC